MPVNSSCFGMLLCIDYSEKNISLFIDYFTLATLEDMNPFLHSLQG